MCGRASVLEERAVLVAPELVGAAADVWDACGVEEVHDAAGPESGAVAVDDRWEFDAPIRLI